jgi:hypothetical protein
MNGKIGFLSTLAILVLVGNAWGERAISVVGKPDPGFAYEDFNNDGIFDQGDLELALPENSKQGQDVTIEIANSEAGLAAKAGIVIPPSVRRLDSGPGDLGTVSIWSEGKIQIDPNVKVHGAMIELGGTGGVTLKRNAALIGKWDVYVMGEFESARATIRAPYVSVYGRTSTKLGRGTSIVSTGFVLLTSDRNGILSLDHSVIRADIQINTRGALAANACNFATPDFVVQPPDDFETPFPPTTHSILNSTVQLGRAGGSFYLDAGAEPEALKGDLSGSTFTGNGYSVMIFANPCVLEGTVFRGQHTLDVSP